MSKQDYKKGLESALKAILKAVKGMPVEDAGMVKDLLEIVRRYGSEKLKHEATRVGDSFVDAVKKKYAARSKEPRREPRDIPRLKIEGTHTKKGGCATCGAAKSGSIVKMLMPKGRGKKSGGAVIGSKTHVQKKLENMYATLLALQAVKRWNKEQKERAVMLYERLIGQKPGNSSRATILNRSLEAVTQKMSDAGLVIDGNVVKLATQKDEEE